MKKQHELFKTVFKMNTATQIKLSCRSQHPEFLSFDADQLLTLKIMIVYFKNACAFSYNFSTSSFRFVSYSSLVRIPSSLRSFIFLSFSTTAACSEEGGSAS